MPNKDLLLFTGEFPYGKKGEPFLNTEIWYLAKEFRYIYIFPRKNGTFIRELPKNVIIRDDLTNISVSNKDLLFNILHFFKLIFNEINSVSTLEKYLKNIKTFAYLYKEASSLKNEIEKFLLSKNLNKENIVAYTYWFDNSLLANTLLKKYLKPKTLISRVHGFDLYDEVNHTGIVPFRKMKIKGCSKIFAISNQGKKYLLTKIAKEYAKKVEISYLGVEPAVKKTKQLKNNIPTVVSCARMEPFKRIPMILESLLKINKEIKWIHFGDGTEYNYLNNKVKTLNSKLTIELKGQLRNEEILEYYRINKVDLLISASSTEGLPVSMMEAISYGIPIVSFDVGGISEIVIDNKTGFLCKDINDFNTFTHLINESLFNFSFNEQEIISFFTENFLSQKNYSSFAKNIANV